MHELPINLNLTEKQTAEYDQVKAVFDNPNELYKLTQSYQFYKPFVIFLYLNDIFKPSTLAQLIIKDVSNFYPYQELCHFLPQLDELNAYPFVLLNQDDETLTPLTKHEAAQLFFIDLFKPEESELDDYDI